MEKPSPAPAISVVMVCDYAAGGDSGWSDTRRLLRALAAQDCEEPVEYILSESNELRDVLPKDLSRDLPDLKIRFSDAKSSPALRNAGVQAASAEFIASIDADCVPRPDWLRLVLNSLREHPEAVAVSGRTRYPGKSLGERISSLLSRAYVDRGEEGPTRFIAENNSGFRRSAYMEHPLPASMGSFAGHVQSDKFRRKGITMWFDPKIRVEHNFEGWGMERDLRRYRGYSTIRTRLADRSLPYAGLARAGRIAIPPIIGWKILNSWWDCLRCGRHYGIRWFELPAAMIASFGIDLLEIPGMLAAYRGDEFGISRFR